jgi:hypothetical protein
MNTSDNLTKLRELRQRAINQDRGGVDALYNLAVDLHLRVVELEAELASMKAAEQDKADFLAGKVTSW